MNSSIQAKLNDLMYAYDDARRKSREYEHIQNAARDEISAILKQEILRGFEGDVFRAEFSVSVRETVKPDEVRNLCSKDIADKLIHDTTVIILRILTIRP